VNSVLTDDMQLISVDDHVVEPPNVWTDRLPAKYREAGPHIVEREGRVQGWLYEDEFTPLALQGNVNTRRFRGEQGRGDDLYTRHYDDMIPSAFDVHARLEAMDEDGVHAQLIFPTFPRFGGAKFINAKDKDLALACVEAYNDWMIDEWCAAAPERFIPQVIVPLWDVSLAVTEMERTAGKGARSVAFVENPYPLGLPSFPTGHWSPVFAAAEALDLVLSIHIGTSGSLIKSSPEAPPSVGIALCGVNSMLALSELTLSDAIVGYPSLRIALSEGGAGWVPYVLERLDYTWERSRYEGVQQEMRPSDLYRRSFWTCIVADRVAVDNRAEIGVDKLMFESDFPHNDSNWPASRKLFADVCRDVPDREVAMIAEHNARGLYRFPRST
jgi:predicted TIM-barrel fold metal-dependent hydrolase